MSSISGSANIGNVGGKLQVSSVSGSLEVGNVGADARVNSISGNLRLGQVNGSLDVSSVSGGLNATLASLSPQGIQIKSVSGSVEIGFKSEVNADFNAEMSVVKFTSTCLTSLVIVKRSRPTSARASVQEVRRLRFQACRAISG